MTKLSVNINKIATLRNARGGNVPDVVQVAIDCERFGAEGITVHPRPDERHIRFKDVYDLKAKIRTEFNIEGYPSQKFIDLVTTIRPTQVTLVPDKPDAITSNAGWNTVEHQQFLSDLVDTFRAVGVRTSIFVGTELEIIEAAAKKVSYIRGPHYLINPFKIIKNAKEIESLHDLGPNYLREAI